MYEHTKLKNEVKELNVRLSIGLKLVFKWKLCLA